MYTTFLGIKFLLELGWGGIFTSLFIGDACIFSIDCDMELIALVIVALAVKHLWPNFITD